MYMEFGRGFVIHVILNNTQYGKLVDNFSGFHIIVRLLHVHTEHMLVFMVNR